MIVGKSKRKKIDIAVHNHMRKEMQSKQRRGGGRIGEWSEYRQRNLGEWCKW